MGIGVCGSYGRSVKRVLLISELGLYPIHFEAFSRLCERTGSTGTALVAGSADIPDVHQQLGWVGADDARARGIEVRLLPEVRGRSRVRWLRNMIQDAAPEAVWIQQEPTDALLLDVLMALPLRRRPRVVGAVCENIFILGPAARLALPLVWRRLDALAAVATASIEGVRSVGMPASVEGMPLVAGALDPPKNTETAALRFPKESFVSLFVGRVVEEKGINVALSALAALPSKFCLVVVGEGPASNELRRRAEEAPLRGRVLDVGLVPHADVWGYYSAADCLVAPSVTTPRWKEQFGGAIADALAAGVPVIGSNSGAIPEVVGDAGLIVPEGSAAALAAALERLDANRGLQLRLAQAARERFAAEFAIDAYAEKLARLLCLPLTHSRVAA